MNLNSPLTLPNVVVIPNCLAKAAMEKTLPSTPAFWLSPNLRTAR